MTPPDAHPETVFHQAILGLGSNLGDRPANLDLALALVRKSPGIQSVTPSPTYETDPVGVEDQPTFLNLVAGVNTSLSPDALMELLLHIELQMGRVRITRWGPRLIDLDLLFYENETRQTPRLTLPHPRWRERSFVTFPLLDLLALKEFDRRLWDPVRHQIDQPPRGPAVRRMKD
jgi:2-amino-4-hydroxy-6-hydroxymethyldihydropteridine diphosphokinase